MLDDGTIPEIRVTLLSLLSAGSALAAILHANETHYYSDRLSLYFLSVVLQCVLIWREVSSLSTSLSYMLAGSISEYITTQVIFYVFVLLKKTTDNFFTWTLFFICFYLTINKWFCISSGYNSMVFNAFGWGLLGQSKSMSIEIAFLQCDVFLHGIYHSFD